MTERTLLKVLEAFLAKKRAVNLDTTLKLSIRGFEIGSVEVKGRIEYLPSELT